MKKRVLQIAAVFTVGAVLAVQDTVRIAAESESRFAHEPFTLRVDVVSRTPPQRPALSDGAGYTVAAISDGRGLSYNQGDVTTFYIDIVASGAGVVTIAPVEVQTGDALLKSAPLRLTVDEPRPAAGMEIAVQFSVTNLYAGQAFAMTVEWRSATPFIQYQELVFEIPLLRDGALAVYPLEPDAPESRRIGLPVNEQRIIAEKFGDENGEGLRFRYMLVPTEPGVYGSERVRLACALMKEKQSVNQYPSYFNNNFFSVPPGGSRFARVYHTAPVGRISVTALPEEGRTTLFCGIVGPLRLRAAVNPSAVVVGDPMMLEVELSDMVFGGQLRELPAATLAGIGASFRLTPEPIRASVTAQGRSFVYALRALRCDVAFVPALAVQIFDPVKGEYRIVRTQPLALSVAPDGEREVYWPSEGGRGDSAVPLDGIRGNRKESPALMNIDRALAFVGRNAWFFWLGAPLAWLCLRGRVRHWERCRSDPAYARAAQAMRRFRREVGRDEDAALRGYLADRCGLCAPAVTAESCAAALKKQGLPDDLTAMVREYFRVADRGKYAPSGGRTPPLRGEALRLARSVERGLRLLALLSLLAPPLCAAASPASVFQRAMDLRAEKPDEASPLFVEAALGYAEQGEFFNAGNCWFFAGESGEALAAYLAAESRAPFNREIRESIKFLRGQRSGGWDAKEGAVSGIAALWRSLCRWDPALRLGFLTLLYLGAWYAYAVCRIFGWRPGGRLCGAYLGVAALTALTLLHSLFQPARGVVLRSAETRLGPGYAYGAGFETPLPQALEFEWSAEERDWVNARLPDGSLCWIHRSACTRVR